MRGSWSQSTIISDGYLFKANAFISEKILIWFVKKYLSDLVFIIHLLNQVNTYFFLFFIEDLLYFISVQLINVSGWHLRIKNGLKFSISAELKWVFFPPLYKSHCQ